MDIENIFKQVINKHDIHIIIKNKNKHIIFSSDKLVEELSEKINKNIKYIEINNELYNVKIIEDNDLIIETYHNITNFVNLLKEIDINIILKDLEGNIIFSNMPLAKKISKQFNKCTKEKYIPELNNWYQCKEKQIGEYTIEKYTEITKFIEQNDRLKHDVLTGLYNRHGILEQLELLKDKITIKEFIVIIGDIDFFKYVNDNYGHNVGDIVLKSIGEILNEVIENGFCGRYGGEEFLIVLDTDNMDEAYQTVENIRKTLEKTDFLVDDKKINLTMSFGISKFNKNNCFNTNDKMCITNIVKKADIALMTSKQTGRNKTLIYDESMLNNIL